MGERKGNENNKVRKNRKRKDQKRKVTGSRKNGEKKGTEKRTRHSGRKTDRGEWGTENERKGKART